MKYIAKSTLLLLALVTFFSCKDEEVPKPDSLIPVEVTIEDIQTGRFNDQTVMIDSIHFADTTGKFNDSGSNAGGSRTISDCNGNSMILFTYSSDDWAFEDVPNGMGPIYGAVSYYEAGDVYQLLLRSIDDVKEMTIESICGQTPPILSKNFEDESVTSGGWSIYNVSGSVNWETNGAGAQFGSFYGQCSNYNGSGNDACETWLISPSVNLSTKAAPKLSFQNAYNYSGDPLEVYVSNNYDGTSDPSVQGTWTKLSPTLSSGGWDWVSSGDLDLTAYKGDKTYVAFVYKGTNSSGSTWEIDDVKIFE